MFIKTRYLNIKSRKEFLCISIFLEKSSLSFFISNIYISFLAHLECQIAVNNYLWDFPGYPVVKTTLSVQGDWVSSLTEELEPHSTTKIEDLMYSN